MWYLYTCGAHTVRSCHNLRREGGERVLENKKEKKRKRRRVTAPHERGAQVFVLNLRA